MGYLSLKLHINTSQLALQKNNQNTPNQHLVIWISGLDKHLQEPNPIQKILQIR
jgi:hypothetical protein